MALSYDVAQRIVDRIAVGLNKQVSVADISGRVLASTSADAVGTRPLAVERSLAARETVEIHNGRCAEISLPLVYRDVVVGAIVLNEISDQAKELAPVAKTLAELIIHQMSVIEHLPQQKWVRDKFVYDLLHGRVHGSEEVMLHEANLLGIDLGVPRIVAVVNIKPLVDRHMQPAPNDSLPKIARALRLEQLHANLLDRMRTVLTAHEGDVYSFTDDHRLMMLAAVDPAEPNNRRQQIGRDIQRFLDDIAHLGGDVASAGIGWYHPGWQALAQSCVEAQFALETGRRILGPGRVIQVEELGLASFVCSDDQTLKANLTRRLLQPLAHEPELLITLDMFLSKQLSPSMTAQALHIHRHTLAYRLDKIAHLTGLDPRAFEAAAQLYAALILQKTNHFSQ